MFDARGPRLALLLGAAVLLVAACSNTPSPAPPSPTPLAQPSAPLLVSTAPTVPVTPTPVPEPSQAGTFPTSVAVPCQPADLKASHGLVEGAAGSRLTSVVLSVAATCSVDRFPALALRDGNGAPLVAGPAGGTGRIDLVGGQAYQTEVRVANWCSPTPRFPVALELLVNAQPVVVSGTSFPEEDDLPPCNGGSGPILQADAWGPVS